MKTRAIHDGVQTGDYLYRCLLHIVPLSYRLSTVCLITLANTRVSRESSPHHDGDIKERDTNSNNASACLGL